MRAQDIETGPYSRLYERYGDPTPELQQAYDSWLKEMSSREGAKLVPFEFDLAKHPEQSIYVPRVDAEPVFPNIPDILYYAGFKTKVARSVGTVAAYRLVNQLWERPASEDDPTPLPVRLKNDQAEGKNTLVVTSHINFQEMGYVKALRHLAKRERHNIGQSGILISKLMSRQKYKGKKLVNHFTPIGNVYFSSPKGLSAERHNVPENASRLTNALFLKSIKPELDKGGLELDAALTGSEVKVIKDEVGKFSHYQIPEVHPSSAKLVENFDNAMSITLVGPPILDKWYMDISDVFDVNEMLKGQSSAEVTDMVYSGIKRSLERFTKRDVVYTRIGRAATVGFSEG
jgi:hypothetical protein